MILFLGHQDGHFFVFHLLCYVFCYLWRIIIQSKNIKTIPEADNSCLEYLSPWVVWWNIHVGQHILFGYNLGCVCYPLTSHTAAILIIRVIVEVSWHHIAYTHVKSIWRERPHLCDVYVHILWNCSFWLSLLLVSYCPNSKFNSIMWVLTYAWGLELSVVLGIYWQSWDIPLVKRN